MPEQPQPKPPAGLRATGKRLWTSVQADYVLSPAETAVLAEACRTWDELERLEEAVRELDSFVVKGSMEQDRMHPLLGEVRAHRSLLAKLGAELNLPDITQEVGLRAGQRHAKKAAVARWTRRDDGAETA
ncbi:MAG: P27 family phage terminase small subunit [Propionibacteriaceae bacterium]